jgi:hypothetical protein
VSTFKLALTIWLVIAVGAVAAGAALLTSHVRFTARAMVVQAVVRSVDETRSVDGETMPRARVEYSVKGQTHQTDVDTSTPVGGSVELLVDPAQPDDAHLAAPPLGGLVVTTIGVVFLGIGLRALVRARR